jgi:hypothetical protein
MHAPRRVLDEYVHLFEGLVNPGKPAIEYEAGYRAHHTGQPTAAE